MGGTVEAIWVIPLLPISPSSMEPAEGVEGMGGIGSPLASKGVSRPDGSGRLGAGA